MNHLSEHHLIFCLVTSCARLNNRRCRHGAVVLTDVVGESPVVHEPEVVPLHHHGLQHDAPGAHRGGGPHHAHFLLVQSRGGLHGVAAPVDSIVVSVFVDILFEFDKYWIQNQKQIQITI